MRRWLAALLPLAFSACAGGSGSGATQWPAAPRPIAALPATARFTPDTAFHPAGTTLQGDRCVTHLVDARAGTRLTLVRSVGADARRAAAAVGASTSSNPQGDFAVEPPTAYGLGAGELLRVDCATGQPLGAVAK